uniref:NADH dehydrogenase subunit 6 n=1 Tax=Sancassania berlesei TaxID=2527844 RepID=A0A075CEZ9_SANBE|nr:NADH dehydrogenase subunit 6 [Sancassania berlesei]AGZ63935.1 NADH dehydrogenase subunit 6 [Sancassania berlesei]
MMALIMSCVILIPLVSPIKVAFTITVASLIVSVSAFSSTLSIFPSAGVVISFSSGMMILFCYCAMMTNYESKNINKTTVMMVVVASVMLSNTSMLENKQTTNNLSTSMMSSSPMLIMGMMVILVSMVCINKAMFSPKKTMISSY